MPEKKAILKREAVEKGYRKFTMTYPSGKTFTRYLSPEDRNQDHDLVVEMCRWAEEKGFTVYEDLEGVIFSTD